MSSHPDGRLAASRNADCLAEACMSTSQGNALRPSLPCCPCCHIGAVQREAFASPFPPAATHSRPVFFPCNFPTPRRISWPSSLQLRRRNFVAAWQQLHGTRCTSARPPRANAPAARQASSCIMHTHPAPCLLERTRNAAGQIPPSLGQAQIPYAEAATLGTMPESLQASMAIDGQATV